MLLGTEILLRVLVVPGALLVVLLLNIGLLGWRLLAIGEAGLTPIPTRPRTPATVAVVVLLMIITVAMHTWLATATVAADRALARIFDPRVGSSGRAPPIGSHLDPVGPDLRVGRHRAGEHPAHRLRQRPGTRRREHGHPDGRLHRPRDADRGAGQHAARHRLRPLPDRRIYGDGLFPRRVNELASAANADPGLWCPDLEPERTAG